VASSGAGWTSALAAPFFLGAAFGLASDGLIAYPWGGRLPRNRGGLGSRSSAGGPSSKPPS
jgi:hypothetical protein